LHEDEHVDKPQLSDHSNHQIKNGLGLISMHIQVLEDLSIHGHEFFARLFPVSYEGLILAIGINQSDSDRKCYNQCQQHNCEEAVCNVAVAVPHKVVEVNACTHSK